MSSGYPDLNNWSWFLSRFTWTKLVKIVLFLVVFYLWNAFQTHPSGILNVVKLASLDKTLYKEFLGNYLQIFSNCEILRLSLDMGIKKFKIFTNWATNFTFVVKVYGTFNNILCIVYQQTGSQCGNLSLTFYQNAI